MSFTDAMDKVASGFVVSRESWHERNLYVSWAVSGSFIAFDKTTGRLEPFPVVSGRGLHVPYMATIEDRQATDWIVMTRQQADRQ